MSSEETLNEIAQQIVVCTRCKLHLSRKKAVPGAGSAKTAVMFIGEGPGFHENEQGLPFVGQAGQFLDELLSQAGLLREDVFITNVVKCRPPGNRDPQPEELEACRYYLDRQIEAINPDVIVTLGRISMSYYINNGKISSIHGKPIWFDNRMIVPMFHPAAALHQPSLREVVMDDFAKLPDQIQKAKDARRQNPEVVSQSQPVLDDDEPDENSVEQLSLF